MTLLECSRFISFSALLLLGFLSNEVNGESRSLGACCHPEQLRGEVTVSTRLRRSMNDQEPPSHLTPIKFSVDYSRGLLFGEHFPSYPFRRHVQFVADIREEVRSIFVRERTSNRCWKFPLGRRSGSRCSLDGSIRRGSFPYSVDGAKGRGVGLIYDRSSQSPNESFLTWLKYRSLLIVDRDTCLPVLDVNADDMDQYIAFHKMKAGLENLPEFWNYEAGKWMGDTCSSQEEGEEDDIDTDIERLGEVLKRRRQSRQADSKRKLLLKLLGKLESGRNQRDNDINKILQLDIYLYLLRHFFPRHSPQPCCKPLQWQASVTKTISYTYVQQNYMGQSTTSMPHIYVDHVNGRLAADIVEYVNGAVASNLSMLAFFAQAASNTSQLSLYVVDKAASSCTYIQVTDAHEPMRNSCMPATAHYERTVRLGGGPLNSVRLDVFNITGVRQNSQAQMDYSAETYVTPHECMPMMDVYSWTTPTTRVKGTLLMSDTKTRITDPSSAFAVPALCSGPPLQLTSAQIESVLLNALQYAGYQ